MLRLLFTLLFIPATLSSASLVPLRDLYYKATVNKEAAERFYLETEKITAKDSPVLTAYKGMASMIRAKYAVNPYQKWNSFEEGKKWLESSVKRDPANPEIRFLRFCIQSNAPFFLGYSDNLMDDKKVIVKSWVGLKDQDLRNRIGEYMAASSECTPEEKKLFNMHTVELD